MKNFQWFPLTIGHLEEQKVTISPKVMYNITIARDESTNSLNQCSEDICFSKVVFNWPYPRKCSGQVICEGLTGNICGSYGIDVGLHGKYQSICQQRGRIEIKDLEKDDQMEIEYWHHHSENDSDHISELSEVQKQIQCYLWCSANGNEPVIPQIYFQLPEKDQVKNLESGMGLSPKFVYTFNQIYTEMRCKEGKCFSVYNLNWHNSQTCEANLICPSMSGNICGDFALGVSFETQAITLCERGDLLQGILTPESKMKIYVFSNVEYLDSMKFQCYLWCTQVHLSYPAFPTNRDLD